MSHQKNLQPGDPEGRSSGLSLKGGLHALRAKRKSRVAPRKEGGISDCTAQVHLSSLKGGTCVVRVPTVAEVAPLAAAFQGHKRPTILQALADTEGVTALVSRLRVVTTKIPFQGTNTRKASCVEPQV